MKHSENRQTTTTANATATEADTAESEPETEAESRREEPPRRRFVGQALVFAREYFPGAPFERTARLPKPVTVDMLGGTPDSDVLSQPDEYDGYVVEYGFADGPVYGFLFSRAYLRSRFRYRLGRNATYFSSTLNLLEVPLWRVTRRRR